MRWNQPLGWHFWLNEISTCHQELRIYMTEVFLSSLSNDEISNLGHRKIQTGKQTSGLLSAVNLCLQWRGFLWESVAPLPSSQFCCKGTLHLHVLLSRGNAKLCKNSVCCIKPVFNWYIVFVSGQLNLPLWKCDFLHPSGPLHMPLCIPSTRPLPLLFCNCQFLTKINWHGLKQRPSITGLQATVEVIYELYS